MKPRPSAINIIWLGIILMATVVAAYTGRMEEVTAASFESATAAVNLAIALVGPMALWLGLMKVAEAGGLLRMIASAARPLMVRLFPDVPPEHPAMSAMLMNIAANALGLGNAATPMGIRAMQALETLAAEKGTATNAMCLFLAINTSSVTILPLGVITVRAAAGGAEPAAILLPTLVATCCSTFIAILAAKILARPTVGPDPGNLLPGDLSIQPETPPPEAELVRPGRFGRLFVFVLIGLFLGAVGYRIATSPLPSSSAGILSAVSAWLIPVLIGSFLVFGYLRGVKVYETITDGAKEGFRTAVRIIPFMVAIFVAIGMFRASGAMDFLIRVLSPLTEAVGMPAEALSMALLRPLSGSGAFGLMSEIVGRDPDGFLSALVSTMQGSTETTFYVLAVYFGSIGIRRTRHALPAALCGDAAGIIASVAVCNLWFG